MFTLRDTADPDKNEMISSSGLLCAMPNCFVFESIGFGDDSLLALIGFVFDCFGLIGLCQVLVM